MLQHNRTKCNANLCEACSVGQTCEQVVCVRNLMSHSVWRRIDAAVGYIMHTLG